jgi:hypothetical protein
MKKSPVQKETSRRLADVKDNMGQTALWGSAYIEVKSSAREEGL